jgi:hypothetical protein
LNDQRRLKRELEIESFEEEKKIEAVKKPANQRK